MGLDDEPLHGLAPLARDRVGAEQPGVLHQLGAAQALEHGIAFADVDRPAEGPASAVRTAAYRMKVAEQRLQRIHLQARWACARTWAQFGDRGYAAVDGRLDEHPGADHTRLVKGGGNALQRLLGGHELLEAEAAVVAAGCRHHQDANASRVYALAGGDATDARDFWCCLAREMLVVLHRHGSIARPQHNGAAHLGILDILAVDTALRCATILHLRHVRNRGLEHGDGVARNVAFSASSDEVGAKAEPGPFGRHGAIGPEGAVRLADAGAELDFTADGVEHEMTILRGAVDEVLGLRPLLPAIAAAHLEDGRGSSGDDRTVLEHEPLARNPLRRPEQLVLHQLGVHRLGGPAGGAGAEALDY